MDQWPPAQDGVATDIADDFVAARDAMGRGDVAQAVSLWTAIAQTRDVEQRHILQAWTFLRGQGIAPNAAVASTVLGVVLEVPAGSGVDVLAAYRDATSRYLNFSGKVAVVDGVAEVSPLIDALVNAGQNLSDHIGLWDKPELPQLPRDHARVTMLTPGGIRFGQGPELRATQRPTRTSSLHGSDSTTPRHRGSERLRPRPICRLRARRSAPASRLAPGSRRPGNRYPTVRNESDQLRAVQRHVNQARRGTELV